MLGLVFLAVVLLSLMGFASAFQRSGTARAYRRVVDWHLAHEAGTAAIMEATSYLRDSVDGAATTTQCADDWRAMFLDMLADPARKPTGKIEPVKARALLLADVAAVNIGPVNVSVPALIVPPEFASRTVPPIPQGIVEFSVKVEGADGLLAISRTVKQRRVFYVTLNPRRAGLPGLRDGAVNFWILRDPMGTVLE